MKCFLLKFSFVLHTKRVHIPLLIIHSFFPTSVPKSVFPVCSQYVLERFHCSSLIQWIFFCSASRAPCVYLILYVIRKDHLNKPFVGCQTLPSNGFNCIHSNFNVNVNVILLKIRMHVEVERSEKMPRLLCDRYFQCITLHHFCFTLSHTPNSAWEHVPPKKLGTFYPQEKS